MNPDDIFMYKPRLIFTDGVSMGELSSSLIHL